MKVTELTKQIHDKYPKVWDKLRECLFNIEFNNKNATIMLADEYIFYFVYTGFEYNHFTVIPFNMLYGLLEDFFEENGIIIEIGYSDEDNEYYYCIYRNQYCIENTFEPGFLLKTKSGAKEQAILKACEIYSKSLK